MQKQKTIYHLVLDKSGSMSDCIDNTIDGFNEQLVRINRMQQEFPDQEITMGLTTFNEEVCQHVIQGHPREMEKLSGRTYRPSGGTALLDAIGFTVNGIQKQLADAGGRVPTTVVLVILTDGHENSSVSFTFEQIRSLISELEATEKWTFSFIGATLDAADVAASMSIKRENSYSFSKNEMREAVWDKLSSSMHGYFDNKKQGKTNGNLFDN